MVVVKPLSDKSVNVSWGSVTDSGIIGYTVYYRPTETERLNEQSVTVLGTSDSYVVIGNLMSDMEYGFEVAAIAGVVSPGERSPSTRVLVPSPTLTLTSKCNSYDR